MKRLSFVSLRIVIALAVILAGARFLMPVNAVEAASPSPETLTTGNLTDNWRYVETTGVTGVPYYTAGGQGDHLNNPSGIAIDETTGGLFVLERNGKRLRSFTDSTFASQVETPATSGVNDPFWGPNDVTRFDGYTWVIDNHHLVVLEENGTIVADWNQFNNPDSSLGWVNNNFNCANSLSFDELSGLLYVVQNCGDNPILALRPDLTATPDPTLTLENAWNMGGDWKHHVQVADLDGVDGSEIYVSGDNFGMMQCLEPTTLPGPWDCDTFASGSVHRGRGITYSSTGDADHIYVLDTVDWDWNQNGLRRCDFSGACTNVATNNEVQPLGGIVFDDPQDLVYTSAGVFFVTDSYRNVVGRLESVPAVSFAPAFGVDLVPYVTDPGYLNNPTSVIVDAQNNLYVAEQQGRRIISYDPAGAIRWEWGVPGVWMNNETTEICQPQGTMAFDPTGNLYVPDRCNGRVVILNPANGSFLSSFRYNTGGDNLQGFSGPAGVAFSPGGRLFVSDPDNNRVQEYRYIPYAGWSYVSTIGTPINWENQTLAPDQIVDPVGLAANGDNEIFIVDQNYNRVQKCTRANAGTTNWTCEHFIGVAWVGGQGNYLLNNPQGIALDGQGRLFVADNNNNRVKVYAAADGSYLASIGTGDWGSAEYEFQNPMGVATDAAGNVYVADSNNYRVQKYAPVAPAMEYLTQMGGSSYVSELVGGYLYTSNGNRIDVYNVTTDPTTPLWVGRTQAIPGEIRDMVVAGSYAYVTSNYGHLVVFNVSNPANPTYMREVKMVGDEGMALALDSGAANLYALTNNNSGVSKYSLADPANPVYMGFHQMQGWNYDLAIHGNTAYVAVHNNNAGQVWSFDTTAMGQYITDTQILTTVDAAGLTLDGDLLYAADTRYGVYLWDTLTSSLVVSYPMDEGSRLRKAHPQGQFIFGVAEDTSHIVSLQISGTTISPAGDTYVGDWRNNSECMAVGEDTDGDLLLYLPSNKGLMTYTVDPNDVPLTYSLVFTEDNDFGTGWQAQSLGNTLYTIDLGILRIFDISDPSAPALINSLEHARFPDSAYSPFVVREVGDQRILYVLGWQNGDSTPPVIPTLETFSVTDPLDIQPLGSIEFIHGENLLAVAEVNGSVVVAVTERGWWDDTQVPDEWHPGRLILFDATDPAALSELASIEALDGYVTDIEIAGEYIFVAEENRTEGAPDGSPNDNHGGGGGLRVFTISTDFSTLAQVAHFGGPDTQKLDVEGNQVFVTDRWNGLFALTIASAPLPQDWTFEHISWFNNDTHDVQVETVDGKRIAWVGNSNRVFILDVTDFSQVSQLAVHDLPFHSDLGVSETLPFMWTSGFGQAMTGWWAAPTMDGTVTGGGTLSSSLDEVTYTFASETLRLWHTPIFQGNLPPAPVGMQGIERAFEALAFDPTTEQPVTPSAPYTMTIGYDPTALGAVDEGSLKLYYWSGTAWVLEPSTLDRSNHRLTAHPDHFSYWSVFGAEDMDPPTGTITINDGAEYTTSPSVTLTLSASDPTTSVVSMRFWEQGTSDWTEWEDFATSKAFILTGGDGLRTIHVEYMDEASIIMVSISDSITLDTQAPTDNSVTINEGEVVNNPAVTLTPASSGAAWMRFSQDSTFTDVAWTAYSATSQAFMLSAGDGLKTVYAQYRDAAGNVTTETISDTVTLDTEAPMVTSLFINGMDEYAISANVVLTYDVSDMTSSVASMRFSHNGLTWSDWEDYAASKAYTLSGGEGLNAVYAQFRDAAGNVSGVAFDTIKLDSVAPTGMILINSGALMANLPGVMLQVGACEDVTDMRFMETNGPWTGSWSVLSPTASFTLTGADGLKTVYAQFRDWAGNISTAVISDSIVLDTHGPEGVDSVLINSGAAITNLRSVILTLTPTDAISGVAHMMIADNAAGTGGFWVDFSGSVPWTLADTQGVQTVYVWYRDALANVTGPFSDTIELDSTAPAGSVTIASGAATTTTGTAALTLAYTGTESGLQMRLSNSVTALASTAWQPYASSVAAWDLGVGNGVKEVFVQFRDSAGNLSPVYSDTILFDNVAPTGSLYINGMADLTNDANVDLFIIFAEEGSGVVQMRVAASEAGLTSAVYAAYTNPVEFSLTGADGNKTVCVQLKDAAGNESLALCDTITLDTTAPVGSLSINSGAAETLQQNVTLTLNATDATSGMGFMMVSNDSAFSGADWQPYAASLAWTLTDGAGSKTVYVKYMDLAGNETTAITDSIEFTEGYSVYLPLLRR